MNSIKWLGVALIGIVVLVLSWVSLGMLLEKSGYDEDVSAIGSAFILMSLIGAALIVFG